MNSKHLNNLVIKWKELENEMEILTNLTSDLVLKIMNAQAEDDNSTKDIQKQKHLVKLRLEKLLNLTDNIK